MEDMNAVTSLRHFLAQRLDKTGLLYKARDLVFVERTTPVKQSFDIISHEKVLSAPVWDSQQKKWVGMVDVRDYLQYVLGRFGSQKSSEEANCSVDHIMNLSRKDNFVPVHKTLNMLSVLRMFDHGLHRVLVADSIDSQEDVSVLSQLDVISWLASHSNKLGEDGDKTLEALGMVKKPYTINLNKSALDAFKYLQDHDIHGMAIVDDNDKIWGNISVTDLKYASDNLDKLSLPLEKFIKPQTILKCTPQTKLIDLIETMANHDVHRYHIVDESSSPVGCVSLTDVMDIMLVLSQEHEGLVD